MTNVYVDLSENGKRIEVFFNYDRGLVAKIKTVAGAKFQPKDKGGPYWYTPLDFTIARELRKLFGDALVIGDDLNAWGKEQRQKLNQLELLSGAMDAELSVLPEVLPGLHAWLRGYQRSGAAFIAAAPACLLADQPGLGKTVEVIAGIYEAGMDNGAHLVIAPLVSLDSVWRNELERWQPHPVWVPEGNRAQREATVEDFYNYVTEYDQPAWLVVNPHMVAFRREKPTECAHGCDANAWIKRHGDSYQCSECFLWTDGSLVQAFERIGQVQWKTVTIDECHKNAVRNPKTLTAQAMFKLEAEKRIAMSGTPIANRPVDLWGMLHFLDAESFSSKWRWAYQWLTVTDNGYGKVIGAIREDRKQDFFRSLTPYVLRRTKAEVLKELPPKQPVNLWVDMTPKQRAQYEDFARDAQIRIDSGTLTATEVLTEYLRCKQFALAAQRLEFDDKDGKVVPFPTEESGKLAALEELLEERGIFDEDCEEKVVVFSQFERVVSMLCTWLEAHEVPHVRLTGKENRKRGLAKQIQQQFQAEGGPRVIVMTTETGGISVTLDRADTCVFMDETWLDSDMEQASDRLHRASRIHNVTCYYIRSKGTIDEYIQDVVFEKGATAQEVLDKRREIRLFK